MCSLGIGEQPQRRGRHHHAAAQAEWGGGIGGWRGGAQRPPRKVLPYAPCSASPETGQVQFCPSPPIHGTLNASPRCTWAWEAWASGGGGSKRSGDVGPGTRMGDLSGRHGFLFPHVTRAAKIPPRAPTYKGISFWEINITIHLVWVGLELETSHVGRKLIYSFFRAIHQVSIILHSSVLLPLLPITQQVLMK